MARNNALRRLQTILNDEDYGPKLARLNRADERRVLDLIERNEGKKARSEILRLDSSRRETRRIRARGLDIETLRKKAYANIRRQVSGNPRRVAHNLTFATVSELNEGATASEPRIRELAGDKSLIRPTGIDDDEINPFWYN